MIFDNFAEFGYRSFTAWGEYFKGSPRDMPLKTLLNLHDDDITPFARNLLEYDSLPEDLRSLITELTRGTRAYYEFQDILDVSINVKDGEIVNRHYAYFESLFYLRESIISWLDRNVLAALTLLRPFLELAIIQLFWLSKCELENSYRPYYEWLKHRQSTLSFNRTLTHVINNLPSKGYVDERRLLELKQVLRNIYKTLCSYHHTPKMEESVTAKSGSSGNISLEIFFYYLHIANILLRQVVYLFILSYPMSLFPVERHKKWGFSGPVGVFFDNINFALLEHYLGSDNILSLQDSLKHFPHVESLLQWFDSQTDLTQEEIDADWDRFTDEVHGLKEESASDLNKRIALAKSVNRSINWSLNYIVEPGQDDVLSDQTTEYLRKRLKDW